MNPFSISGKLKQRFREQVGTLLDQVPSVWHNNMGNPVRSYPGSQSYWTTIIEKEQNN